jgi:hypothetical protein
MAKLSDIQVPVVKSGRQTLTVKSVGVVTSPRTGTTSTSFRCTDAGGATVFLAFAHSAGGLTLMTRFAKVVGIDPDFDYETCENSSMTNPTFTATVDIDASGRPSVRPDWTR